MDRQPTLLDDILVGEVDDITFPCAASLKSGETIADAVITCTHLKGTADASASSRVSTPREIVGSDVIQRVTGVVGGAWYSIVGLVTLSSGRKLIGHAVVMGRTPGA